MYTNGHANLFWKIVKLVKKAIVSDMPVQKENQLLVIIEKFLYKGFHNNYLSYAPEFLGFAKDYVHTPEQFVDPEPEKVFTKGW